MAFPVVEASASSQESNPGVTSHTVSLPASIVSGDLLVVFFSVEGTPAVTWPSGYTVFTNAADFFGVITHQAAWRVADGSEGSSITITTDTAEQSAHQSFRLSGHNSTAPEAAVANSSAAIEDPPSLSPSWGTKDTLWFAGYTHDGDTTVTSFPTNYTGGVHAQSSGGRQGDRAGVALARRNRNVASEDPGAYTLDSTRDSFSFTVAVEPGGAAPPSGTGALAGGGVLAGIGEALFSGTGALQGGGTLQGVGEALFSGTGALQGGGTLQGTGQAPSTLAEGIGALQGGGALSGVGEATFSGSGVLQGGGALSGVGEALFSGTGAIAGGGTLQGTGQAPSLAREGTGTLSGGGTLQGVGEAVFSGSGALAGGGALSGVGEAVFSGLGALQGGGALQGIGDAPALAPEGTGALSGGGSLVGIGAVAFSGTGVLSGGGRLVGIGPAVEALPSGIAYPVTIDPDRPPVHSPVTKTELED